MELEVRNTDRRACGLPCALEILDRLANPVEHPGASICVIVRPFEPSAHVAFQNRHSAAVAAFGFLRVEGNKALFPINLFPLPGQKFTKAHTGEVGGYE